jgi:hypothetical protein
MYNTNSDPADSDSQAEYVKLLLERILEDRAEFLPPPGNLKDSTP